MKEVREAPVMAAHPGRVLLQVGLGELNYVP
jgi:hypothetical protein